MQSRFERAIEKIDAYNANDPRHKERLYSERMSTWLMKLEPVASEPLRLAARAQHIGRWTTPRGNYPMDRRGYKQWREELADFHAETTAKILRETGYGEEEITRVRSLLKKKNLKTDPECQTLEDVICLVFLEYEFADFATKHREEKVIRILQRTWLKMSERGHKAALGLQLPPELARLVQKALAG
ncbi:MAG: DUF4202 domain-containing protein [Bryobacterales bacterium]|nr:DUF4202 domain-containing protein [Bryobacterales bacterium]